jgi:hypothetical protein
MLSGLSIKINKINFRRMKRQTKTNMIGRFRITLDNKFNLDIWKKARPVSSVHSSNNPNVLRAMRKHQERTCPWIGPVHMAGGARVHEALRAAVIGASPLERILSEVSDPITRSRVDAMGEDVVFEFKAIPDQYNMRHGISQAAQYAFQHRKRRAIIMVPMTRGNLMRFNAYKSGAVRVEMMRQAFNAGVQIVISPVSDIPPIAMDSQGFANVFSVAKQLGIHLWDLYTEVENGTIAMIPQKRKKEDIFISVAQTKRVFGIQ